MNLKNLKEQIKGYFNLSGELEDEAQAREAIKAGVSFRGSNIIILILAIFIASLGLNTNSPAVIIGAMLISPLMGPIIGIGLGAGTYDFALIKRSARNLIVASLFSVATATIYFLISPVSEGHSELLARTSPTIYDVLIGFFGGAAGIVAIACKNKGNVIPGVAIATALMPPLCTAGYGLATWQMQYFLGASYLFIINSIFISFATLIGVKLFKFRQTTFPDANHRKRVKRIVTIIVVATILPSAWLTFMMIRENYFESEATEWVNNEFRFNNTQIFSQEIYTKGWEKHINVTLIGDKVNIDSLTTALKGKMEKIPMLKGTILTIHQGIILNDNSEAKAMTAPNNQQSLAEIFNTMSNRIERQNTTIDSLQTIVNKIDRLDSLAYNIAPEMHILYPDVKALAINRIVICDMDNLNLDTINTAIIDYEPNGRQRKPDFDLKHLKQYLEVRTGLKNIQLIDRAEKNHNR